MKSVALLVWLVLAVGAQNSSRILSRKKRYLIFPEGSSLQLVYCLTMPVLGKSTIFTIGGTAALAWELPHDPFSPYRRPAELLHRKDEDVKPPSPAKYKKPYFFKRPMKYSTINYSPAYKQIYKRKDYQTKLQKMRPPVIAYSHPIYHHVHRRTRRDLYSKIEKFFAAQSKDGKACLLKSVCEVSQAAASKGSFMQEIIKAVFRVKPYESYEDEDDYDKAAKRGHNCTEMYPTCRASVWNFIG